MNKIGKIGLIGLGSVFLLLLPSLLLNPIAQAQDQNYNGIVLEIRYVKTPPELLLNSILLNNFILREILEKINLLGSQKLQCFQFYTFFEFEERYGPLVCVHFSSQSQQAPIALMITPPNVYSMLMAQIQQKNLSLQERMLLEEKFLKKFFKDLREEGKVFLLY